MVEHKIMSETNDKIITIRMREVDATRMYNTIFIMLKELSRDMAPKHRLRLEALLECLEDKVWDSKMASMGTRK